MPSRMSCSDVTTSSTPCPASRADDLVPDQRARADHVDPARVHEPQRSTLLAAHVQQGRRGPLHLDGRQRGQVDTAGVVGRQTQGVGRDGRDAAGQADQRPDALEVDAPRRLRRSPR